MRWVVWHKPDNRLLQETITSDRVRFETGAAVFFNDGYPNAPVRALGAGSWKDIRPEEDESFAR